MHETAAAGRSRAGEPPDGALETRDRPAPDDVAIETRRVESICEDQIRAWRAGWRIPAESHLALAPPIPSSSEAAFEVVYNEFMIRESLGERPSLEEFAWRFPDLADRLARQFAFHSALGCEDEEGRRRRPLEAIQGEGEPETEDQDEAEAGAEAEDEGGCDSTIAGAPRIAGYRVIGELGRGGAGVVYKARQVALNRLVALKVILADHCAQPDAVGRFRIEAEVTARLQHPNIIQVYEIGEHEGIGYLTLEYAEEGSLEAAVAGSPWDPARSAALLEELARAIHYAHERGIVHRDLKPANIVMTACRVPKITDFGLAKLLEQGDGSKVSGAILGTPSYMAPEQLLGSSREITPAADVYALGAILYELLTGRPPFKGGTPLETLDLVVNHEAPPPGRLRRGIPPDLETICLKCLDKAPLRRYQTARAVADDLRRFLEGRPILARRAPVWEQAAKWGRRRPALACALAGLVAAVALFLAGGLYYNALLRDSARTAQAARAEADRNAQAARDQRNLAMNALDKLIFEVQEKLGETPSTRSIRSSLLGAAIAGLDRIEGEAGSLAADLSLAVAHQKLGEIYRQVGRDRQASHQFERAIRLAKRFSNAAPRDLSARDCLRRSHVGLGEIELRARRVEPAIRHFDRVRELAEEIASAAPSRPKARRALFEAYLRLGRALGFHGDFAEARGWFQKAAVLAGRWRGDEPGDGEAVDMLAWSRRKLADISKLSGDLDAARVGYLAAIAAGRENLKAHPSDAEAKIHLAAALDDLAGVLVARRAPTEAVPLFSEAETLFSEAVDSDPESADVRIMLVHAQSDQARLLRGLERFGQAAVAYHRAIETLRQIPREAFTPSLLDEHLDVDFLQQELAACENPSPSAPRPRPDPPR